MAIATYNLTPLAIAANRYTAAAQIDINLANPSMAAADVVCWTTTTTDTAPTVSPALWNKIPALGDKAMTLPSGTRLWLACHVGTAPVASLET